MSRIRSIHPSFFTDEHVLNCSLAARMLYAGIWTEADCQGVFEWRPTQLKVRLLPMDAVDMAVLLGELIAADLIREFSANGQRYGAVREFRAFQRPKNPTCLHPLPENLRVYVGIDKPKGGNGGGDAASFPQEGEAEAAKPPQPSAVNDSHSPEGGEPYPQRGENLRMKGREGEGVGEGVGGDLSPRRRGSRLPTTWTPSSELAAYGVGLGLSTRQVVAAAERFRLHWGASAGRNAVKLDWDMAFQGWLRDDVDRKGGGTVRPAVKVF